MSVTREYRSLRWMLAPVVLAALAMPQAGAATPAPLDYYDLGAPAAKATPTQYNVVQAGLLCDSLGCDDGCGDICGNDCSDECGDACGSDCCDICPGTFDGGLLGSVRALPGNLMGCFCPSQCGFDDFISPMTNPIFFEDPRTLTELRAIYFNHKVPTAAGGGEVDMFALQIRAALNDRLSIVAAKDGYMTSSNPLIDDGWADVALGLKYNLFSDAHRGQLLSTGFSYELPVGSPRSRQGNGDGEFHLYLTGGTRLGCRSHWLSASGFRLPADDDAESTVWYWSNHFDTEVRKGLYAFTEFNWYHWMESGSNPALAGVEGVDAFNFGSTGVAGNDIVTGAIGLKLKPSRNTEIGVAYEIPLTEREDVIDHRLTADLIWRY